MTPELLGAIAIAYIIFMFGLAHAADRASAAGRWRWMDRPAIYTLSLSVYCSAWTFYGAVGYASRSGLEFLTIYLGPGVLFAGAWWGLRRLVRVARMHRVTSIADLVSSRFGKSPGLGMLVTLIAVVAATPYLALQMQSVTMALGAFADPSEALPRSIALWVAIGLAAFAILFGTRNLAADERHHGVVIAIAFEAVVKLAAFLAVGIYVVWGIADGPADILARINKQASLPEAAGWVIKPERWTVLIALSGAAIITLPRMFQVLVVEASDDDRLRQAGWAFPVYMLALSIFVLPIAVVGRDVLPVSANPDLHVLNLPLAYGHDGLATFVFLGGFSSAMSMVVVSAIALSTMVANHWLVPLWLWLQDGVISRHPSPPNQPRAREDLRNLILNARRLAIVAVVGAGWFYHEMSGGTSALAAMGIVAFSGMTQVMPALVAGMLWRGATRRGAMVGIASGSAFWLVMVFLPSLGILPQPRLWAGIDPFAGSVLIALMVNLGAMIVVSLADFPNPAERLQAFSFVNAAAPDTSENTSLLPPGVESEALLALASRILGGDTALHTFRTAAAAQGKSGFLPDLTPRFLAEFERSLAGSVGAATASALTSRVVGHGPVTVADLLDVAREAHHTREANDRLATTSGELARTARQLRETNEKLTVISAQKDAFLGQISHELRTPMTSIRAFSEIMKEPDLPAGDRARFAGIIHDEAARMTRLLENLLDLSVLEGGQARFQPEAFDLARLIERALLLTELESADSGFRIVVDLPPDPIALESDPDRLLQVLINVLANARKYCDAAAPQIEIRVRVANGLCLIDITDNGTGIAPDRQALIFEKFSRLNASLRVPGAGLGLAICREIMTFLGGDISYLPGQGGASFRILLPVRMPDGETAAL